MKITFVLASGFSMAGGDRVIAIYAERLKKRGHDVLLVSRPKSKPTVRDRLKSLLKGEGWISVPEHERSHFDDVDVPRRTLDSLRPVSDRDVPDADVVVATWWETAAWVAALSERKGAKVYFIQHYEIFDYLPADIVKVTYSLPLHKIAIAGWLVEVMRSQYGDSHVSLVPNSVDTTKFYAPPRGKQFVPTIGLLYSGTPWKGCDVSLKAFSLAQQQIPNLRLVAFGESLVPNLPLPPGSEYVDSPEQDTLKDLYAKCDAWLFGSRNEGFGLPILEAMACRTPVIGTPTGAAPELLAEGRGVLVKPDDAEDMAKAIVRVCNLSDAEWRAMSDAAYAKAVSYTWDDAADRFEAALCTAVERNRRGDFLSPLAPNADG